MDVFDALNSIAVRQSEVKQDAVKSFLGQRFFSASHIPNGFKLEFNVQIAAVKCSLDKLTGCRIVLDQKNAYGVAG